MSHEKIRISKKETQKGADGYKTFSIRVKEETVRQLDAIATQSNRTRNELVNIFLEYGVNNYEITPQ